MKIMEKIIQVLVAGLLVMAHSRHGVKSGKLD